LIIDRPEAPAPFASLFSLDQGAQDAVVFGGRCDHMVSRPQHRLDRQAQGMGTAAAEGQSIGGLATDLLQQSIADRFQQAL
jgi:hypothetical protein